MSIRQIEICLYRKNLEWYVENPFEKPQLLLKRQYIEDTENQSFSFIQILQTINLKQQQILHIVATMINSSNLLRYKSFEVEKKIIIFLTFFFVQQDRSKQQGFLIIY
ncbi:hypothetical protein pb186bvf_003115 [Paramecium bursaria]